MDSNSPTADPTADTTIERLLSALPGIAGARILTAGGAGRVAYVAGPGALRPLPDDFQRKHGIDHVVPVTRIAADNVLAALPVWDRTALESLSAALHAGRRGDDIAVAAAPRSGTHFLSRACLAPEAAPAAADQVSPEPATERGWIGQRLSDRDAIVEGAALTVPADYPRTLVAALERAASGPHGVSYLGDDGAEQRESYADLHQRALAILGGLQADGASPGSIVALDTREAANFIGGLSACLLGGLRAAPMALPEADADPAAWARLNAILEMLGQPRIVASPRVAAALTEKGLPAFDIQRLATAQAGTTAAVQPGDIALIILTSGSTGVPKGVRQSHAALLAMALAVGIESLAVDSGDVFFNWMPLDHVGGIVFQTLMPMILGCRQIHARTAPILADPIRWVDWVARYGVTVSWAPNFAFGLIADAVADAPERPWDLSRLRVLPNGGEAVSEASLADFLDGLAPNGLRRDAMRPTFGMSETCTAITLARLGHAKGPFASLGGPVPGSALRIAGDDGTVLKEGEIGRLHLRGPQIFAGYHERDDLTAAAFHGDWFETGDVGFVADGQLYMTGRLKDSININGAKFFAHEIEAAAAQIPGIERASLAAVPVRPGGSRTDRVALFFSAPQVADEDVLRALLIAIRSRLAQELSLAIDYLLPVPAEAIPRTGIGKIIRPTLKQRFEDGAYETVVARVAGLLGGPGTVALSLHRKIWQPAAIDGVPASGDAVHLALAGSADIRDRLSPQLESAGLRIVPADTSSRPDTVLHLAGWEGTADAYRSLLSLARTIAATPEDQRPRSVLAVTAGGVHARDGDRVDADSALLIGLVRSLGIEMPGVRWRILDVPRESAGDMADIVGAELRASHEPEVAWRDGQRLAARFEPVEPAPPTDRAAPIRQGDLWLVTGGLGGIGRAASAWLLGKGARLLLVGRTDSARLSPEKTDALHRLQGLGDVRYVALDAGDATALAAAVTAAEAETGASLAGALHLAGVGQPIPLEQDDGADIPAIRQAALAGQSALRALMAGRPAMRLLLAGSIMGRVGGHARGYAAVNAAAAESAAEAAAAGQAVSYLAFSSWLGVGMSEGRTTEALLRADGLLPLDAEAGLAAIEAALWRPGSQWLVGLDDRHPFHAAFALGPAMPLLTPVAWVAGGGAESIERHADALGRPGWVLVRPVPAIPRDAQGAPDVARLLAGDSGGRIAPRDEAERRVAQIVAEVLSIENPAANDDFFLAGGTSLLATRLAARLSKRFFVDLPAGAVFRNPTITGLTQQLRALESKPGLVDAVARQLAALEDMSADEREALRARASA